MNKIFIFVGIALLVLVGAWFFMSNRVDAPSQETAMSAEDMAAHNSVSVAPVAHATAVLSWSDAVVYADPVGGAEAFAGAKEPDLIVVTDIHGDHLSTSTLAGVLKEKTVLVVPQAVADLLPGDLKARAVVMRNGEKATHAGFSVEAIPMYNLPESTDSRHAKGRGNGYVIERNDLRLYVAGDTADIPEMRALTSIDVALVPMNLPYTMSVESAASSVLAFAPKTVYPYHYRQPEGFADVAKFKELVNAGNANIEVVLLDWYPEKPQPTTPSVVSPATGADKGGKSIEVSGKNFEYDLKEIRVKAGETVTINFTSTEGFHDWVVDEFNAKSARVQAGGKTSVTFVAGKTGTYEYYCSVGKHRASGMVGKLIVE